MSLIRSKLLNIRLSNNVKFLRQQFMSSQEVRTVPKASSDNTETQNGGSMMPSRPLTLSQKRYLMFALKHKTMSEIPDVISDAQLNTLYSRARITVNLLLGAVVLVVCLATVYSGKSAAEKGDTIEKRNKEFHKRYQEEAKLKQQ